MRGLRPESGTLVLVKWCECGGRYNGQGFGREGDSKTEKDRGRACSESSTCLSPKIAKKSGGISEGGRGIRSWGGRE